MDDGLDERDGDAARHRGDQVDPLRGQPRGEQRHREHQAPRQACDRGVAVHHLQVGEDVGTADVETPVHRAGEELGGVGEVVQHVAHRDRLYVVVHPSRGDHYRESFAEVAQHLETGRSGADDDRCLQDDCGHTRVEQDSSDFRPGGQMRGQPLPGGADAAQIDDPSHPGRAGTGGHGVGGGAVQRDEVGLVQGVHQVVDDVLSGEGRGDAVGVGDVRGHHVDLVAPGHVGQRARTAGHRPYGMPPAHQFRYQPAADVAGRSQHRASHTLMLPPPGPADVAQRWVGAGGGGRRPPIPSSQEPGYERGRVGVTSVGTSDVTSA